MSCRLRRLTNDPGFIIGFLPVTFRFGFRA
jgi:hypothetical protein